MLPNPCSEGHPTDGADERPGDTRPGDHGGGTPPAELAERQPNAYRFGVLTRPGSPVVVSLPRRAAHRPGDRGPTLRNVTEVGSGGVPAEFARAVESLTAVSLRPEVIVERIRPPQRLAPWSFALGAQVLHNGDEVASGRLVLLHDPAGYEAWEGTMRLVSFASADLDSEMAADPLLPAVGWSWLRDALADNDAQHTSAAGTVTLSSSTRFGDLADQATSTEIELRASWTPLDDDLGQHLRAWSDLLCSAAGLPPPGVAMLPQQWGESAG